MTLKLMTTCLLLTGCGSVQIPSLDAAKNGGSAAQSSETDSSGSTGSLALSEPEAVSATGVAKIRILVTNPEVCAREGGNGPGHRPDRDHWDKDGRRPPPPPPPRRRPGEGSGPQDSAALTDDSATSSSTDSPTADNGTDPADSSTADSPSTAAAAPAARALCTVKDAAFAYQAGTQLTVDEIQDGTYTITVILEDSDGKALEQGSAEGVEIKAGEVASADITLSAVPESGSGSVAVTVHEAADPSSDAAD